MDKRSQPKGISKSILTRTSQRRGIRTTKKHHLTHKTTKHQQLAESNSSTPSPITSSSNHLSTSISNYSIHSPLHKSTLNTTSPPSTRSYSTSINSSIFNTHQNSFLVPNTITTSFLNHTTSINNHSSSILTSSKRYSSSTITTQSLPNIPFVRNHTTSTPIFKQYTSPQSQSIFTTFRRKFTTQQHPSSSSTTTTDSTTSTTSSTAPNTNSTPNNTNEEDDSQGSNLVRVQQAVNQWAHLNYRGMEFLRSGTVTDLDNAESCFTECASAMESYPLLPYRSLSLANLASCLMRKGNYKEAIKLFQPLTQQLTLYKQVSISQIATIHMELASAYELSGQHDLAVKELYVASSRFVHAASHFLSQIQQSDDIHFQFTPPPNLSELSPKEQELLFTKTKDALKTQEDNAPQFDTLREDQRSMAFSNALDCWRTALGCRYSAIVIQHRMSNLDFAVGELKKLNVVYKYVLDCAESVQQFRWDRGEGEADDISMLTNDKGELVNIEKTLVPHALGADMLQAYPLCPPEAKVVTRDLARLFPDMSLHHLSDFYGRVAIEYVSILHSLANVYIDQGEFEQVCVTLQASVDVMNPMDEESFLKVASEASKTLRLLYEKLLLEQQNYQPGKENEPCIIQVSDNAKVKFENKASIEKTINLLNTTRANILALFTTYIQSHVLKTNDSLEAEVFGASSQSTRSDSTNNTNTNPSSYQSSASSSTINLDDLPADAKQFFNFNKDQMRRDFESGQFYEHMRKVYKREMGPQFREDLPELLKLKPEGYKALHEREHIADTTFEQK